MMKLALFLVGVASATSCTLNNIAFAFGNIKADKSIESAEACLQMCEDTDGCEYYTYNVGLHHTDEHGCFLKDASALNSAHFLKNSTSGPKTCCAKTCDKGASFVNAVAESAEECQLLCYVNPQCVKSAFGDDGDCIMKMTVEQETVSLSRCCGTDCASPLMSPCVESDISYVAPEATAQTASSLLQCAQMCDDDAECEVYTYHKDGRCWLAKMDGGNYQRKEDDVVSGRKYCGNRQDIEYKGTEIMEISGVTEWPTCRVECMVRDACEVWVFNATTNVCKLRSSLGQWGWGPGGVSGLKFSCFDEHIEYSGANINSKPIIWNMYESCQAECKRNSACNFFTHNNVTKECWLKGEQGTEFKRNDDVVSGFKTC